jgi:TfoX/Sxy family transcriptional regulator of competence genes
MGAMAYDEALAERIRDAIGKRRGVSAKEMFGGIAFLVDGKMFIGVVKDELMVRVGKDRHQEAISKPHARTMDFTGRPMEGYVFVKPAGITTTRALAAWIDWAYDHVAALPAKKAKKPKAAKRPKGTKRPGE